MAVNGFKKYDFYITSDDRDWEVKILQKLQQEGFRGYYRGKFTLGGLKTSSRLHGVQNCRLKIIGFPSPSKRKTDTDNYVASLALEHTKRNDDVICVRISKDSIIPDEYSALVSCDGWDEDALCRGISDRIKSFKSGGNTMVMTNTAGYMPTRDTVDSSTVQELRTEQDFGPITDLHIAELSTQLGNDWSLLATYLGISIAQQQDLRRDFHFSRERNEQMLVMWRGRGSGSSTEKLKTLASALEKCKRLDLKEEVSQW